MAWVKLLGRMNVQSGAWVKLLGWMNVQSGVRINGVGRRGLGWSVEISSHGSTLSRQHTVHRPGQGSTDIRLTLLQQPISRREGRRSETFGENNMALNYSEYTLFWIQKLSIVDLNIVLLHRSHCYQGYIYISTYIYIYIF